MKPATLARLKSHVESALAMFFNPLFRLFCKHRWEDGWPAKWDKPHPKSYEIISNPPFKAVYCPLCLKRKVLVAK